MQFSATALVDGLATCGANDRETNRGPTFALRAARTANARRRK